MVGKLDSIGKRLVAALEHAGITQSKLAQIIKTSQPAVSNWCSDKKAPTLENLTAIAHALRVNLEWLRDGNGDYVIGDLESQRKSYMENRMWGFRRAPTDGGRDFGNSNIWTLSPKLETLVREVLQNARDAVLPDNQKVEVVFRIIRLRGDDLSAYEEAINWPVLETHLEASTRNEQKLGSLLRDGLRTLKENRELLLLVVEDYGTTGLIGPEKGDGKFAALCRDNLYSNKEGAVSKGGSYGLGKGVLWRASQFATVMFCSNLSQPAEKDSNLRILGRCDLSWHELDRTAYAGPGWYGRASSDSDEDALSFWANEAMASDLYLDREKSGTSACVVGFHDPSSDQPRSLRDFAQDLEEAAARHFFPAITKGELTVKIETFEGRRQFEEKNPSHSTNVNANDLQPEYCELLQSFHKDSIGNELISEGDIVSEVVRLTVPKRKEKPQREFEHDARVLVRLANEETSKSPVNKLAIFRGPGMVVKEIDLRGFCLGARPVHALLLAGRAVGNDAKDDAADEFLRTAEPPEHNEWTSTAELKGTYVRGCVKRVEEFLKQAKDVVRELIKPPPKDLGDGPQALKELFRLGNEPTTLGSERPKIVEANGEVDEQDRWRVEATIWLKSRATDLRLSPIVLFAAETGGGQLVQWESVEALEGCRADGFDIVVPARTKQARFRGVTDPESHPVSARESCVVIDLRKVVSRERAKV